MYSERKSNTITVKTVYFSNHTNIQRFTEIYYLAVIRIYSNTHCLFRCNVNVAFLLSY